MVYRKSRGRGDALVFLVVDREGFQSETLKDQPVFDVLKRFKLLDRNIPNHLVEIVVLYVGSLSGSDPYFVNLVPALCTLNSLFNI